MKGLIKTLLVAAFIVALSGCSMVSFTSYKIDVLKPADYTLPENVHKILLINCAEETEIDSQDSLDYVQQNTWGVIESCSFVRPQDKQQTSYMKSIPSIVCTFIATDVNRGGFKEVITDKRRWLYPVALHYADTLCRATGSDAILLLHNYDFTNLMLTSKYHDESAQADQYAICNAQLTLVEPGGRQYDFEPRHDTLIWSFHNSYGLTYALREMPRYNDVYYSIAEQVGRTYAFQMVPQWYTQTRYILSTPDRKMQDAALWTERGNWENAADIWREVYKISMGAQRARAAYNLSLYYEHEGLIDEAAIWCSKALDFYGTKPSRRLKAEAEVANQLFGELVQRQQDFDKLDRQTRK